MPEIYLDNNATSRPLPAVIEAMTRALSSGAGNPSSQHAAGHAAGEIVDAARRTTARWIGAAPTEVFFTSGGTEANNLALKGLAFARREAGASTHAVATAVEHPSVLVVLQVLQRRQGWEITLVPPEEDGVVDPDRFAAALRPDTAFASMMLANNETGVLQPVAEAAARCRRSAIPLHCDAAQAAGRIAMDVGALGADVLTFTAHKTHGPAGVGVLWRREGARLMAQQHGGEQEGGLRAGTENVAALAGLAALVEALARHPGAGPVRDLRDRLELELLARVPGARVNGAVSPGARLPNTTNLFFPGVAGSSLLSALVLEGVAVSRGSACHAGVERPSHVLRAMGRSEEEIAGSVRFSLGLDTTAEEVERGVGRVVRALDHARRYTTWRSRRGSGTGDPSPDPDENCCGQPLFPA